MVQYKNLELTPGIGTNLSFRLVDDTYLDIDTTGYTFKLEVFSKIYADLKLVITTPVSQSLGLVIFNIDRDSSATLDLSQYSYRLIITSPALVDTVSHKGFITILHPVFDASSTPSNSVVTLPDGSIYSTTAITIVPGQWYSLSAFRRFVVSGIGKVSIDGRNTRGTITMGVTFFDNGLVDEFEWNPPMANYSSFRIAQLTGSNVVRYYP